MIGETGCGAGAFWVATLRLTTGEGQGLVGAGGVWVEQDDLGVGRLT